MDATPTISPPTTTGMAMDICKAAMESTPYQTFYAVVVVALMALEIFILSAVVTRWSVLQRNIVHVYVISCLLSVIFFCTVAMAELFHSIHHAAANRVEGGLDQSYNASDPSHRALYRDDAFLKGTLPALLLIMEFNIAALVYAISDGTLIVGRYGEADSLLDKLALNETESGIKKSRLVKWKKTKAMMVLATAWTIPLVLAVPVAFGWNCVEHCLCLPMYRTVPTCIAPSDSGTRCSRTWPPMSRSYVITTSVMFFICFIVMGITLASIILKFYNTHSPQRKKNSEIVRGISYNAQTEANSDGELVGSNSARNRPRSNKAGRKGHVFSRGRPSIYTRKGRPPLSDTIKLIIYLTICLFLFISPLELFWFIDVLREADPTVEMFAILLTITFLYVASVPVMLLFYMAGVRKACIYVLMKCPCCSRIVVTVNDEKPKVECRREKPVALGGDEVLEEI